MWWIKKKDQAAYEKLMGQYAQILQESGDYIEVVFSADKMQTWVQCGYWYGGGPGYMSSLYQFLKNCYNRMRV
jgi:hypothetical protein